MDSILAVVNSFSPSQRGIDDPTELHEAAKTYLATLEKLPHSVWQPVANDPDSFFQSADPRENSIGYCFVLHYLLRFFPPSTIPHLTLANGLVNLFTEFDPKQILAIAPQFKELLELLIQNTILPPPVTVELLACVIRRAEPNRSVFTSAHLKLAKLVYDTRLDDLARDVLDVDILFYPKSSRPANANANANANNSAGASAKSAAAVAPHHDQDEDTDTCVPAATLFNDVLPATVLEYNYIRALTLIQRHDWVKAKTALEQVLTHPTKDKTVSMFMAEAHKKWLLVGLLAHGHAAPTPPQLTASTKMTLNLGSAPYADVADLFSSDDADAPANLKACVERNAPEWAADGNTSLVAAVLAAYQKWQIINLRHVYHRVSIAQIRSTTSSADADADADSVAPRLPTDEAAVALVAHMIDSGMLRGELELGPSGDQSFLTFHDETDDMAESDFAAAMTRSRAVVEALSEQYRVTSQRLSTNPGYIRHLARQQKLQERDVDAGVGFDTTIEDEDLMTGVMSHM